MVEVAFFGVLLLIKDFFWTAISIPPSQIFGFPCHSNKLTHPYSTGDAKVDCTGLRRCPCTESMSCSLGRTPGPKEDNPNRLIINLSLVNI
jgi:hypothetical protein